MSYLTEDEYKALCETFDWEGVPTVAVEYGSHTGWDKFRHLGIPTRHYSTDTYWIPADRADELRKARKGYRCSGMPLIHRDQSEEALRDRSWRKACAYAGFPLGGK